MKKIGMISIPILVATNLTMLLPFFAFPTLWLNILYRVRNTCNSMMEETGLSIYKKLNTTTPHSMCHHLMMPVLSLLTKKDVAGSVEDPKTHYYESQKKLELQLDETNMFFNVSYDYCYESSTKE
jgi:hypothetical protein